MGKRFFLCTLLAMTMAVSMAQQNKYSVAGEVIDTVYNGKIYLYDFFANEKIDSTDMQKGRFTFNGMAESPKVAVIVHPKYGPLTYFVLESGTVNIELMTQTPKITGTSLNEGLSDYGRQLQAIGENGQKEQVKTVFENVIAAHGNDILGVLAFYDMDVFGMDAEDILQLIDKCGNTVKEHPYIINQKPKWEALKKTSAGKMFTDFTVEYNGKSTSLSDYVGKGKYVLVDFWASWCGPCRREIPNIASLYSQYKDKGLEVLGVATWDKPEDTLKAIEELNITWPQIINAQRIGSDAYSISGIPQIILFAPDGKIVARNLRGEELKKMIGDVMNK